MILSSPRSARQVGASSPARPVPSVPSSSARRGATALATAALVVGGPALVAAPASAADDAPAAAATAAAPPAVSITSSLGGLAVGHDATVSGTGFAPGSTISVAADGTALPSTAPIAADASGAFTATVRIPADAPLGDHEIVATAADGATAKVTDTFIAAPDVPFFGAGSFGASRTQLQNGAYQVRYSLRQDGLWVTNAEFNAVYDVVASKLQLLDRRTLKVRRTIDAKADGGQSPFGVAVDDRRNTLWTTDTVADEVSVWNQATGKRLATIDGVAHARDAVVDPLRDRVYVSAFLADEVQIFDAKTFRKIGAIPTGTASGPVSLALDPVHQRLYTTTYYGGNLVAIDTRQDRVAGTWSTGQLQTTGVGVDPVRGQVYTAGPITGDVRAFDGRTGKVLWKRPTGTAALSVAADPITGRVFVANRLARSVSVLAPRDGKVLANVEVGPSPNSVTLAGGTAYVVNKGEQTEAGHDGLTKLAPKAPGRR
ncbi:YncE family protein [Patulibacter minatonensis]|uniref:YncE family protein n=1 Tax=Patulibacter minatonensis TaxID=298163 RepID=UPI000479E90B|nr:YncE family protein [Patulibacter minatonensis]